MGKFTDDELDQMKTIREEVGAKPLRLGDLRRLDRAGITPTPEMDAAALRALRESVGASQAVMAEHLGVATATVGQWERGLRKPDGPARRLLSLIQRHGLDYVR